MKIAGEGLSACFLCSSAFLSLSLSFFLFDMCFTTNSGRKGSALSETVDRFGDCQMSPCCRHLGPHVWVVYLRVIVSFSFSKACFGGLQTNPKFLTLGSPLVDTFFFYCLLLCIHTMDHIRVV